MLASHFRDEIAGLQKWSFLAGFNLFWCSFFYCDTYLWANYVYFAKKNCPQMSFPGRGEVPNGNLKSCNFVIYLSCKIFTKTHVPLFVS